jgi:hypothetical protein
MNFITLVECIALVTAVLVATFKVPIVLIARDASDSLFKERRVAMIEPGILRVGKQNQNMDRLPTAASKRATLEIWTHGRD